LRHVKVDTIERAQTAVLFGDLIDLNGGNHEKCVRRKA
jgi:hypothetical protein